MFNPPRILTTIAALAIAAAIVKAAIGAAGIEQYSTTPGSNTAASPVGAPEGMARSAVNDVIREMMSYIARFAKQETSATTAPDAGSANAYAISPTIIRAATGSYSASAVSGAVYRVKAANTNTSTVPTLSVNGETAITVVKLTGAALAAGDIQSGMWHEFVYDATAGRYVLLNPHTALAGQISYSRIATGVEGSLMTFDANGLATHITPGPAGLVLTSSGAGAQPTFKGVAGTVYIVQGGAMVMSPYVTSALRGLSAHSLSGRPEFIARALQVVGGDDCGYGTGEQIDIGSWQSRDAQNSFNGFTVVTTSTSMHIVTGAGTLQVPNKGSKAICDTTAANWALILTPYKFTY